MLDWAPTYLDEVKGFSLEEVGWAYFAYEWGAIPGTLLAGYLSDKVFNGKRAPVSIIYMILVTISIYFYWQSSSVTVLVIALTSIGFLIYGPVMLIGVHALDLVPKKAAGTAAGLTGLFGYMGGSVFANIALGFIVDKYSWDAGFEVLLLGSVLAIVFIALAWRKER